MDSRIAFAKNLQAQLDVNRKTRKDLANDLGFGYTSVCDWCNGKKYPRIDKIEAMAKYFRVSVSDLTLGQGTNSNNVTVGDNNRNVHVNVNVPQNTDTFYMYATLTPESRRRVDRFIRAEYEDMVTLDT